ncbi:flagellar export chaperone FliS [Paenibacillus cremeus]|uniref:Flagellar secretion chaperone FliS n=2 Tax=Paenibacillus cremeus TaxID=2163881 RepID=A0A559KB79_9BACL|nr:flagellar export chaperone FliS [Paenibacillus cremeus]
MNYANQNKYLETSIQTATPAQLLIMLYDGAIRFCRSAIEAVNQKKYEEAHNFFVRTQDIVMEFAITLDKKAPMAEQLLSLYDYFIFRLTEANTQKVVEPAQEVLAHLMELKETWIQAARQTSSQGAATTTSYSQSR